jgi:hypothetical protein
MRRVSSAVRYDAKGASDADAKTVIDGIYESGEKALAGG